MEAFLLIFLPIFPSVRILRLTGSDFSLYELHQFNNGNHTEAESDSNSVFLETYVGKAECFCEERDFAYQSGENKACRACDDEGLVHGFQAEDGLFAGAHVEAVEDLSHGKREERHGNAVSGVCKCEGAELKHMTDAVADEYQY